LPTWVALLCLHYMRSGTFRIRKEEGCGMGRSVALPSRSQGMSPVCEIQEVTDAQNLQCLAEASKVGYFFKCLLTLHPPRNPPFHVHVLAKFVQRL